MRRPHDMRFDNCHFACDVDSVALARITVFPQSQNMRHPHDMRFDNSLTTMTIKSSIVIKTMVRLDEISLFRHIAARDLA